MGLAPLLRDPGTGVCRPWVSRAEERDETLGNQTPARGPLTDPGDVGGLLTHLHALNCKMGAAQGL